VGGWGVGGERGEWGVEKMGGEACATPHAGPGLRALAVLRHHTGPVRQIVLPPSAAAAVSSHLLPASGAPVPGAATGSPPRSPPGSTASSSPDDGAVGVCSLRTLSLPTDPPRPPRCAQGCPMGRRQGLPGRPVPAKQAFPARPAKPHPRVHCLLGSPAYIQGAGTAYGAGAGAGAGSLLVSAGAGAAAEGAGAGAGIGRRRLGRGRRAQVRRGYGPEQWAGRRQRMLRREEKGAAVGVLTQTQTTQAG